MHWYVRRSASLTSASAASDIILLPRPPPPLLYTDYCYPNPKESLFNPGCFLPAFDPALALYDNVTRPVFQLRSHVIAKTNRDELGVTEMSGYIAVRTPHFTVLHTSTRPLHCRCS